MSVLYIKGKDGKFVPIFTVKGADGSNGIDGAGIEDITYKSSEGLEDTYEITYTDDRQPTYFTVTNGQDGTDGKTPEITIGDNGNWYINGEDTDVKAQGEDGVSPTVAVDKITGGHKVTITDKSERHEFDVLNGKDGKDGTSVEHRWEGTTLYVKSASGTSSADLKGEKGDTGKGFTIKKVYQSYDEMVDDKNGNDVKEKEFVLISTNDVEDPYNSQLYIKVKKDDGSFEYKFLNDLSGAQGIQGVGIQSIEKTASNGVVDTYTITYTDGNKTTFTVRNSENLNIENGSGNGAIQQKVAESIKNQALGDNSVAFGRKTISYQYGCFGSGGSCIAGFVENEEEKIHEFVDWVKKYDDGKVRAGHTFVYDEKTGDAYVTIKNYTGEYRYENYESYVVAMGDMSVAKGRGCVAMGVGSKVLDGYGAFSIGSNSEVETDDLQSSGSLGGANKVIGSCSYTMGTENNLYGNFIHSIGYKNILGHGQVSSNIYAYGYKNTLIGSKNYAFGGENNVQGNTNVSIGTYNFIYGGSLNYILGDNNYIYDTSSSSVVLARVSNIWGSGVYAFGAGLKVEGSNKTVLGRFNAEVNDSTNNSYSIFELGDGKNKDNRYTVLQIYKKTKKGSSSESSPLDYTAELKGNLVLSKGGNDGKGNPTGNARTLTTDNIICWDKLEVGEVTGTNNNRKVSFTGLSCEDEPSQPTDVVRKIDLDSGLSKKVSKMETLSNDKSAYLYAHKNGVDIKIEATHEVSADQVVRRDAAGKFLLPSESGTSYAASEEYVDKKIKDLEITGFVAYEHKVITKRSSDIYHILSARGTYFNQAGGVQSHIGYFMSMQCENLVLAQPIGINNVTLWGNTIYFSRYNYEIGYSTSETLDFNYIDTIKYYSVKNLATGVEEILIDIKE